MVYRKAYYTRIGICTNLFRFSELLLQEAKNLNCDEVVVALRDVDKAIEKLIEKSAAKKKEKESALQWKRRRERRDLQGDKNALAFRKTS